LKIETLLHKNGILGVENYYWKKSQNPLMNMNKSMNMGTDTKRDTDKDTDTDMGTDMEMDQGTWTRA
jgi:hypothetical protein